MKHSALRSLVLGLHFALALAAATQAQTTQLSIGATDHRLKQSQVRIPSGASVVIEAGATLDASAGAFSAPSSLVLSQLSLGAHTGLNSLLMYDDGGLGGNYGAGMQSGEIQWFTPAVATHFSWNKGGDLQPSGTNELMRLSSDTGNLLVSGSVTAASFHGDGSALTGVGGSYSPAQFATDSAATPAAGTFTAVNSGGTVSAPVAYLYGTGVIFEPDGKLNWGNDAFLLRAAAGTIAQRNGTNPQTSILSRTYTDTHNYSQLNTAASGSTVSFTIAEEGTGVGTLTGYSFDNRVFSNNGFFVSGSPGATGVVFSYAGNGIVYLGNTSATDLNRIVLGGTTSSFPGIARTGSDVEIVKANGDQIDTAIILSSADGHRFRVTVGNDGTLHTTAL